MFNKTKYIKITLLALILLTYLYFYNKINEYFIINGKEKFLFNIYLINLVLTIHNSYLYIYFVSISFFDTLYQNKHKHKHKHKHKLTILILFDNFIIFISNNKVIA